MSEKCLSDFYVSSIIAILGGFKGRLHATGEVDYFLYAFNVKTINIPFKKFRHLKKMRVILNQTPPLIYYSSWGICVIQTAIVCAGGPNDFRPAAPPYSQLHSRLD